MQLLWTKRGKWLALDDSPSNGADPDVSMIALDADHQYMSTQRMQGPESVCRRHSLIELVAYMCDGPLVALATPIAVCNCAAVKGIVVQ